MIGVKIAYWFSSLERRGSLICFKTALGIGMGAFCGP